MKDAVLHVDVDASALAKVEAKRKGCSVKDLVSAMIRSQVGAQSAVVVSGRPPTADPFSSKPFWAKFTPVDDLRRLDHDRLTCLRERLHAADVDHPRWKFLLAETNALEQRLGLTTTTGGVGQDLRFSVCERCGREWKPRLHGEAGGSFCSRCKPRSSRGVGL